MLSACGPSDAVSREELVAVVLAQREQLAEQAAQLVQARTLLAEAQATSAHLAQRVGELARRVRELEDRQGPTKPQGLAGEQDRARAPGAIAAPTQAVR